MLDPSSERKGWRWRLIASAALAWTCCAACQITSSPAPETDSTPPASVESAKPAEIRVEDARANAPSALEPAHTDASSGSNASSGSSATALQTAPPPATLAASSAQAPVAERWVERSLPASWDTVSTNAFERALDAWVAPAERVRLAPADLAALASALDRDDPAAMRAALLLARSRDPSAGEALMKHLEKRIAAGEFDERLDAPDVVAAAAFGRGLEVENREARLVTLALGKRPHPDFEVRVECAASALELGRDQVIPFLVHVLRERTSARVTKPDWTRKNDVDWAQWRASRALAARAGTTALFDPSASMHARLSEAERLEELCRPFVPKAP